MSALTTNDTLSTRIVAAGWRIGVVVFVCLMVSVYVVMPVSMGWVVSNLSGSGRIPFTNGDNPPETPGKSEEKPLLTSHCASRGAASQRCGCRQQQTYDTRCHNCQTGPEMAGCGTVVQ